MQLDDFFTRFADSDRHWGPFLFLRPRAHQMLGVARVLALCSLAGLAFGLLGSILLSIVAHLSGRSAPPVHIFPLAMIALYFCLCQLTFVPVWNRRASRLAKQNLS